MGFEKGNKLGKGRPKGSKNERSITVELIAAKFKIDPFEVLMMTAVGDWKGLGFDAASKISYSNAGIEFEEPNIKLSDRVTAAKEACRYLYSTKQAVSVSTPEEGSFRVTIEDYSGKK